MNNLRGVLISIKPIHAYDPFSSPFIHSFAHLVWSQSHSAQHGRLLGYMRWWIENFPRVKLSHPHANSPTNSVLNCKWLITEFILFPVPSVAPTNLQIKAVQPTEIFVEWNTIPDSKWHGRQLGYRIKYKPYHDSTWIIKTVPKQYHDTSITGMKAFTLYVMEVEAYTGKGPGLPVAGVIKTPEGGK